MQFAGLLYYPSTEGFNSLTSGLLAVTGGGSTMTKCSQSAHAVTMLTDTIVHCNRNMYAYLRGIKCVSHAYLEA